MKNRLATEKLPLDFQSATRHRQASQGVEATLTSAPQTKVVETKTSPGPVRSGLYFREASSKAPSTTPGLTEIARVASLGNLSGSLAGMTTTLVRAAIYLRISLDREMDGLAIDRQRADCVEIANSRGWTISNEYVDQSLSATDKAKRRPAYDLNRPGFHAAVLLAASSADGPVLPE